MTRIEVQSGARRRIRPLRLLGMALVIACLGICLWTWITLSMSYADAERAGVLQKFGRRGWVCKTHEGEIAMYLVAGISPQMWQFSVRDPAVAAQLDKAVGHRVQLHYTEHPGVPTSCFAETRYFVDRVTINDTNPLGLMGTPGPAPGAPAADSPTGGTASAASP